MGFQNSSLGHETCAANCKCQKMSVSGQDETRSLSADSAKCSKDHKSLSVRIELLLTTHISSTSQRCQTPDPSLSSKTSVNRGCVSVHQHMLKKKKTISLVTTNETQRCVTIWKQKQNTVSLVTQAGSNASVSGSTRRKNRSKNCQEHARLGTAKQPSAPRCDARS